MKKPKDLFFKYHLSAPDHKYMLHHDLDEVSGLSYFKDNQLAMIEDETGKMYIFDLEEGKVSTKIKFAKSGDYEGVEIWDDRAFVIRSDGKLFSFDVDKNHNEKDTEVSTLPLSAKNDVEGLGYVDNHLIIACKGSGGTEGKKVKGKAFYSYDVDQNKMEEEPYLVVKKADLESFVEKNDLNIKIRDFKPSGIAQHPITKHIFILAHGGKLLVVMDSQKHVVGIAKLTGKGFKQPEGISFDPKGTLYISNEAQGGRANVLKFNYHAKND